MAHNVAVSACPLGGKRVRRRTELDNSQLALCNIRSLTSKSIELAKALHRHKISMTCIYETKWVGAKAKEIDGDKSSSAFKRVTNGVCILVEKDLMEQVVEVMHKSDHIIFVKLVAGLEIFNVVGVYAPQIRLDEDMKKLFWEDLNEVIQGIIQIEELLIGSDFYGHIGRRRDGYETIHESFGYCERNSGGVSILDFAVAYELLIVNSYFKKKEEYLIMFKSGNTRTQIDFFLMRANSRRLCRDCKITPSKCLATQQRLLVMDVEIKSATGRKRTAEDYKLSGGI